MTATAVSTLRLMMRAFRKHSSISAGGGAAGSAWVSTTAMMFASVSVIPISPTKPEMKPSVAVTPAKP